MGRLIDANKVLNMDYETAMKYIETANDYDVDKVVTNLKHESGYIYDDSIGEDGYFVEVNKAIEIVKGAVKDE